MDGWELYDTVEANGEFGPWSDWSATKVDASATREVETQTRYRYRDKETTTSSASSKDGWTKYDTTYSWGNYGSWSGWSTSAVSNSESRKVETKTQYRYRNISYSTEYTSWGSWSGWQDSAVSETDLRDVETRTVYPYYYFNCINCGLGARYPYWGSRVRCKFCGQYSITEGTGTIHWYTTPWSNSQDWGGGKKYQYIDGYIYWNWTDGSPKTQYRYRTRTTKQVANYGSWSSWGDTAYSGSSTREVQTRKVYRYCDRSQVATYHFYRWGSWSGWSANAVSETSDRDVESATYYRYRDKVTETTYYFRKWSDWSEYSESVATPSETTEVETKTQYRFKSKLP